jgi:two-component system chemotaxis response regulator CheB
MTRQSARPVRVLLVDDSATARGILGALIADADGLEVCGEAENGRQAIAENLRLSPDIISLDLEMPVMDGLSAVSEIMSTRPRPILIVSDITDAANAMDAVSRGALDAIAKPGFDNGAEYLSRLRLLAGVPVIRHLRRPPSATEPPGEISPAGQACVTTARACSPGAAAPVVAIAVSTGGPDALRKLLPSLPVDFPAPVLIAQHIADGFATGMAEWLGTISRLPITIAREGERVQPGRVYLVDPARDLMLDSSRRLHCPARDDASHYRPSCDRLLRSVAKAIGRSSVGVILTGMGRDGVAGIEAVHAAGGVTIAQDETSSLVFGMNREAILSGRVQRVLPLADIAQALCDTVAERMPRWN